MVGIVRIGFDAEVDDKYDETDAGNAVQIVGKPEPVVVGDPPIVKVLPGHNESSSPALALMVSIFIVDVNTLLHLNGVLMVSE